MAVNGWIPSRWNEELCECIWLKRLLDKGRRALESEKEGQDLMNGYLFGNNDYADGKLLKFLNTDDNHIRKLLREMGEDTAVAEVLIRESGRSKEEIQNWNKGFCRTNAPFIAMWDADEGRRTPGVGTRLLDLSYNFLLMPPVYLVFWFSEKFGRAKHH